MQNQSSSMLTLSLIKSEINGFGRYHVVTHELFHAKTTYFRQLNTCKRVPFHLGTCGTDQIKLWTTINSSKVSYDVVQVCGFKRRRSIFLITDKICTLHLFSSNRAFTNICDRICENPACRENAQVVQCAFLVPQVENCQSPVFVIFMSKNLSTNYCRRLRRVNVSSQGKISLYLQAPRST